MVHGIRFYSHLKLWTILENHISGNYLKHVTSDRAQEAGLFWSAQLKWHRIELSEFIASVHHKHEPDASTSVSITAQVTTLPVSTTRSTTRLHMLM
jgi:hypothetical protein